MEYQEGMSVEEFEAFEEETELMMEEDRLNEIADEIRSYSVIILDSAIKIGKRFVEAKELCPRGKWGEWVKDKTGYEQSMAENYMKIYREYGGGQLNLGGDFTKSQSIASLGVTKLLELSKIPADEREAFVEENNITDSTTVKELKEKIKALEAENDKKDDEFLEKENEVEQLKKELKESSDLAEAYEFEIEELKRQVKELEENPPQNDMEAMQKDSEIGELENTIAKLEKEKEKLKSKADKAQDKIKEAEEKQAAAENENKELKEKLKDVENALSKAKKQMAGSETLTKINVLFGNVQHELSELLSALDSSDEYAELKTKVLAAISERLGAR